MFGKLDKKSLMALAAATVMAFAGCEKPGPDGGDELEVDVPHSAKVLNNTKNFPAGGVLTVGYSDHPSGSDIGKLADNDYRTKYMTSHSTAEIVFEADKAFAATSYSLVSAADAPECDPSGWTLSGSEDGTSWTVLDTKSGETFANRGQRKNFELSNKKEYEYYKLVINATKGGEALQIAEFYMISKVVLDIDDLMDKASGWSTSSKTPMGTHFENRRKATAEDIAWLKDINKNPDVAAAGIGGSWETCNVNLYPFGSPMPADVNQHAIGDCCACALWAALAYSRPEFIKSIIKSVSGGYEVKMYDPNGNPVTVGVNNTFICDRSGGNIQQCSGKNNVATWATVLEKAMMKWQTVYRCNYPIGGIGTEHVAPLFTGEGNSFAFAPGALNATQLAKAVTVGLEMGYLIVGGFNQNDVLCDGPFKTVQFHAFTAMHPMNKTALFAMRNPWGSASGSPDGKEDGVMHIFNDNKIPQMVDLRVIYGGGSSAFLKENMSGYVTPSFAAGAYWVSEAVMRAPGREF